MSRYGLSLLILVSTLPGMAVCADDAAPAAATQRASAVATATAHAAATVAPPAMASAAGTTATPAVAETPAPASAPAAVSHAAPATAAEPAAGVTAGPATSNNTMAMPADDASTGSVSLPTRGMDMANVEHIYGTPLKKLPPVPARGTPHHPPITRWVYANFVVYFEYDHVVHAVIKAHPFRDSDHG